MKDKFEEAINGAILNWQDTSGISMSAIKQAAGVCNTLHQQAMKEAVEKALKEDRQRITKDLEELFNGK